VNEMEPLLDVEDGPGGNWLINKNGKGLVIHLILY
jgi:hypothetical protein